MSSRYVLAGWGQRGEPNREAEWETDRLKGPSMGWEGLKPRRGDVAWEEMSRSKAWNSGHLRERASLGPRSEISNPL